MGKVVRLETRRELVQRDAAAEIEAQLDLIPPALLPDAVRASMLNALHRLTRPDDKDPLWPGGFNMISRIQTKVVWDAIRALPGKDKPALVRHAFDLVLLNLNQDTNEVMLTRDQMAEELECEPKRVSSAMGVLERLGVIRRERRPVEGLRGPGVAVYILNEHVGWNGSLEVRKSHARQTTPPALGVVPGGKAAPAS